MKADPSNLQLHDDLAVAYQKTGKTDKAIEVMLAKETIKPGVYETYSNLGTFYILKGEFAKGLPYIDKALAINPDAHFGREKYQKWLVEYAMTRKGFPMRDTERFSGGGFAQYLAGRGGALTLEQLQSAVKGVSGMIRFADYDNPLLLEALGDLLEAGQMEVNASHLAARCYLLASYRMNDETAKAGYRELADNTLEHTGIVANDGEEVGGPGRRAIDFLERDLKLESADADAWYANLKAKEVAWIQDGANVEEHFDRLYREEPVIDLPTSPAPRWWHFEPWQWMLIGVGFLMAAGLVTWGVKRLMQLIA